jgi:trk system potassium uptake protein
MKYIIIGLGNFGASLAAMLTDRGHEVIGIDSRMNRVDEHKDLITSTICLDCADMHALSTLPLNEADVVIVAIGEDFGASVMVTALLIQRKVKRLICRAVSPVHESVFLALGVKEVVHPELDAAKKLVRRIDNPDVIDTWQIAQEHQIVELVAPRRYVGCKVVELDIKNRFQLNLVTIIKHRTITSKISEPFNPGHAVDFVYAGARIEEDDVLVLFGKSSNIRKFIGE